MEGIAPPLALLISVRHALEQGQPVKIGIQNYLSKHQDEYSFQVLQWLSMIQQGQPTHKLTLQISSIYRRNLLNLLERGLKGESIHMTLTHFQDEIIEACQDEIARKIAVLPMKLLLPMLGAQFPAFIILLFGPILQNFFHS